MTTTSTGRAPLPKASHRNTGPRTVEPTAANAFVRAGRQAWSITQRHQRAGVDPLGSDVRVPNGHVTLA